jgi:23S rRNA (guanosine2251-2'-O)-methyltransferase
VILYGANAVLEALRGRRRVRRVWAADDSLVAAARDLDAPEPVKVVAAAELERLSGSPQHQGLVCEAEPYPYADATQLLNSGNALVVALDQVQDPQNLGAVCRSAEAAGATGVAVPRHRSAEVTPAVCKASAGAVEHLAVARVRNLADFLGDAKRAGCWCYGADATASVPYDGPDFSGGVVVVLGSEGRGLRPRVASACDELLAIPLRGRIGSLNVSAAAAVLLYEIVQQRENGGQDSITVRRSRVT